MNIDLTGKTALITGGARGIGRQICLKLAEAGAAVIINYSKSADAAVSLQSEIAQSSAQPADTFKADVSKEDEVTAMFSYIRKTHRKLDILVNNAGVIKDNLLIAMEYSDWDKVLDINLRGTFLCSKYAAEQMMANHSGRIINIASIVAIKCTRGQANYAASKGGVVSFTKACAVELAPKGILVNAILPGMILTDMSARARKRGGDALLSAIPLGRYGTPDDVAGLAVFLASDLSGYITGQAIPVDGGMTVS
ncbi:3-oxoacyl-ACP reductase FabG [Candidatus Magnetominusculus xianensis]|uniref:Beta-ketoacyl-ACP reductase n=1 Tax=Candidatus Magnetominusculus xianensis TaxID=1748249 RepID=A0ABR5SFD3_9BACT|nr:3-oxoacyl-ACP reductase FabG [Candidatus Magnetominusculus xianensis]KWT85889.1 beta-ketoacyl-ACP reductase [Candidatus Magnetominusculus xianensis]MBF0403562.1 3-oxoacyl-ACP reductase FabG [Nitrospirota bacterium]